MSRKIKRAFLGCAILMIVSSMLMLGSTMAWFQDSKVVINTFTFGELDVDIMHKDGEQIVSATAVSFKKCYGSGGLYAEDEFLFEPGATFQLEDIYVKNSGSVPFRYKLEIDSGGISIQGERNLLEAMDIYMRVDGAMLSGEVPQELDVGELSEPISIYLHMKEDAGNEYQDLTVSGAVVRVVAVQRDGIPDDELDKAFADAEKKTA